MNKEKILTLKTSKCLPQFHGILIYVENLPINAKYIFEEISITYRRNNSSFGFVNYKNHLFKINKKINDGSGFINIRGNNGILYQAYIRNPYLPYDKITIKNFIKEYNFSLPNVDYEKSSNMINFFGEVLNKIDTTISKYLIYLKEQRPLKVPVSNIKENILVKRFSSGNRCIDFYFFKNDGVYYEIDCFFSKKKILCNEIENEIKIPFYRHDFPIGKQLQVDVNITTLLNGNLYYEVVKQSFIIFNDRPITTTSKVIYRNKIAIFECPDSGSEPIINKIWSFKKLKNGYAPEIDNDIEEYNTKFYFKKISNHSLSYNSILYANSTDFQNFGHIQCTVVNEFGEGTIDYHVIELEKMKSHISFTVNSTEIYEGDTIMFNCTSFKNDETSTLQIYAPSVNGPMSLLKSTPISPNQQIFIIDNATPQHSGDYSCFQNTHDGFITEEKVQIFVHQGEIIFPEGKIFNKNVNLGDNVLLECPIIVQSYSFVQWSFINETNPDRTRRHIDEVEGNLFIQNNGSLKIQHMTINNVGQYIFEVHFDDHKEECNFRVYITFKDPEVKIKQKNDYVDIENKYILKQKEVIKVGEPLSITCLIEYESSINVNASLVKNNGISSMELNNIIEDKNNKVKRLTFYKKHASLTDNGEYLCMAKLFYFQKKVIITKTNIIVAKDEYDKNDIITKECNVKFPDIQTYKVLFFVFFISGILETLLLICFIYIYISTTILYHRTRRPKRF
uniref:Ig-like domain-containing protein n=1 Tax=Strongyloides venezuelensis TaxID=75913 RepID=A0A0K0F9F7_STRVS